MSQTVRATSTATDNTTPPIRIAWLRNELRVRDNYVLEAAARDCSSVLPLVIFDEQEYVRTKSDIYGAQRKTGAFRAQFHRECVQDLRKQFASLGIACDTSKGSYEPTQDTTACSTRLMVAYGSPSLVIGELCQALYEVRQQGVEVVCAGYPCWEEQQTERTVEQACQEAHGSLTRVHEGTMYHPRDISSATQLAMPNDLPNIFTPWRNRVERAGTKVRQPHGAVRLRALSGAQLDVAAQAADAATGKAGRAGFDYLPSLAQLMGDGYELAKHPAVDNRGGYFNPCGGETAALARLQRYIWDEDRLKEYFDTRNGMVGQAYSTKLAPWLAKGCISPRFVHAESLRYERERGVSNKSTYWVRFELMVRDYFIFYAAKAGKRLFFEYGVKGSPVGLPWRSTEPTSSEPMPQALPGERGWEIAARHLQAWKTGCTGHPLVDANMRELAATGFMSNRGRQNVASYLVHNLNLDWRLGAAHFEELLVDYTPEANWGNWHAIAGFQGGRINRFNVVKQGQSYDADGCHARLWCPELAHVPDHKIHEPWKMTRDEQKRSGCIIGETYPAPLKANFSSSGRSRNTKHGTKRVATASDTKKKARSGGGRKKAKSRKRGKRVQTGWC